MPKWGPIRRALCAALLGVAALGLAACGDGGDAPAVAGAQDPGAVHVHALGENPADGSLMLATHTGLFRRAPDGGPPVRVADRYQDTMGFTVVGPNHFLGSGHPDLREDLPPLLGLIESRDAGRTWRPLSLRGEADFHTLRVIGRRVYGYDSRKSRLMVSTDGGRTWPLRHPSEPLIDFVVDPQAPGHLLAATRTGLIRSRDSGRTWTPMPGQPGLLAWRSPDALYAAAGDGGVQRSADGGATWRERGTLGSAPAALTATPDGRLLAAVHDGTTLGSDDGGYTWTPLS